MLTAMRAGMKILVLNAGSSSLKFAVFNGALMLVLKGQVSGIGSKPRLEVDGAEPRATFRM